MSRYRHPIHSGHQSRDYHSLHGVVPLYWGNFYVDQAQSKHQLCNQSLSRSWIEGTPYYWKWASLESALWYPHRISPPCIYHKDNLVSEILFWKQNFTWSETWKTKQVVRARIMMAFAVLRKNSLLVVCVAFIVLVGLLILLLPTIMEVYYVSVIIGEWIIEFTGLSLGPRNPLL